MAADVNDCRKALLSILARLDQLDAEAETMIAEVANTELAEWAGDVRGILTQLSVSVAEHLARLAAE